MPDAETAPAQPAPSIVEDFATEIAGLETCVAVRDYMMRVTASYGFTFFFIGTVPTLDIEKLSDICLVTNIPDALIAGYDRAGLLQSSPGLARVRTTTTPFRMSIDEWRNDRPKTVPEAHTDLMRESGLEAACYFPVHDAEGGRAVVIMMSRQTDLGIDVMTDLHMVFLHVYNRLSALGGTGRDKDVVLSDREVQCLTWTAAGKTSAEIAGILGLSEHTVNHYLNHVAKKLKAVNRTQAVVKAMRLGLIS